MALEDLGRSFETFKPLDFLHVSRDNLNLTALIGILLTFIVIYDFFKKRGLPAGPLGLPLLGNYLSLPKSKTWILFTKWSKKYGGIYTFYNGVKPRIIISDPQIAYNLLTGRSSKYSSRPRAIVFERFSHGSAIISQPYGPSWSIRRKFLHQFLNPSAIQPYKERQEAEACRLMYQISGDEGEQWIYGIQRYTASVLFSLSYGHRIDSLASKVFRKKMGIMQYAASLMAPGRYLVESIPILDYFPSFIARWKVPVDQMGKTAMNFDVGLVNDVRKDIEKGKAGRGSLTENMISAAEAGDQDLQAFEKNEINFASVSASLFGAGSITTITSIKCAVLAMIVHPWVFVTAQKEIDDVVGIFRSPAFADMERLPFIEALVKETLRWKPVAPIGLNHSTTQDDIYEGYKIPKGTAVTFNTWAMHMKPSYFPSPEEFAPERFLPETDDRFREELIGEKKFPGKYGHGGFGWGRRTCAGADLAMNNLWIALVKLIWAFELMPADGETYEDMEFDGDVVAGVRDFRCRWRVRSEEYGKIIEREMKAAEEVLNNFPAYE